MLTVQQWCSPRVTVTRKHAEHSQLVSLGNINVEVALHGSSGCWLSPPASAAGSNLSNFRETPGIRSSIENQKIDETVIGLNAFSGA